MATSVHDAGLKRIGRYELVRHLATGGMAEIYVARLPGIGGFQRHVTLKTIRPERVEDQAFVHMFLDEARLVAGLHHHNVCQVHDVGVDEGTYYLALEYVHGESTRAILERARDLNVTIPLEISLAIVAGAAAGLHHSHESRNPDGTLLGLVHRDVSPSNILVGYDGSVKLIDFGIARAQTGRHTETQTGMIKGKFGYMSPEQCRGWPVDRRSDVFGLGIVLYELTTQTRAFRAENDYETMQRIVRGDVTRPSRVSSGYPLDLELVVLRALSVDPDARFPTASAMLEMVERCARRVGGLASPATVGRFLTDLFGARAEPWREDDDDKTDDGSIEDIELVEAFDGPSALGFLSRSSSEPTGPRSAVTPMQPSVEADVITMTTSVPLPGLPASLGAAPLSPLALYAEAEADVRPRARLASGTQPLPMGEAMPLAGPGAAAGSAPALPLPVPPPVATPAWDLPGAVVETGAFPTETSGRAATAIVPPLQLALATALRNRWVWIGLGAALGILVGVGVGVAVAPAEPPGAAAPSAPAASSLIEKATRALEIGQAEVLVDGGSADARPIAPQAAPAPLAMPPAEIGGAAPSQAVPPDRVLIRITSEPSKATVLLDGKRLGKTPFVGAMKRGEGDAEIKVRRRGYKTMRVDVDRAQDIRLHVELPETR